VLERWSVGAGALLAREKATLLVPYYLNISVAFMSVVLLQAAVGSSVPDSVIEISPRQNESLGHPPVVRIERRVGVKPSKVGVSKLLVEVVENSDLTDDECRLSTATLKVVGVPAKDCVRLTHLECLTKQVATTEGSAQQPKERKGHSGQNRDEAIEAMQAELNKLEHERDWYMQQAETFRSQLAVASEELDLASVCYELCSPSFSLCYCVAKVSFIYSCFLLFYS